MLVKLLVVIPTLISLLILEHQFPFFCFQNSWRSRIVSNFELGVFNSIVVSGLTLAISGYPSGVISHLGMFERISSPAIAGIGSILILDLYMYLWHKLMHQLPVGWKFHRVHHTDRSMNVSTAYRFHPIEILSSSIPKLGLIWWLGIGANLVWTYELIFTVIVAVQHSNLAIPNAIDRSLSSIVVTPGYHRIHHSQLVAETNSNYGSVFTWWDRLFQTHRTHNHPIEIQLGILEESRDLSVWHLIELPLTTTNDH